MWRSRASLLGERAHRRSGGRRLIADHPEIGRYLRAALRSQAGHTITYGAHEVLDAPTDPLADYGLAPAVLRIVVCRPIPENSVLEIVRAWSARPRGRSCWWSGPYGDDRSVPRGGSSRGLGEVEFPGAIFDQDRLRSLRFHARLYLHGHTVGGTNPSLVEAMAAGNAVIAHDNVYNTWVAGSGNRYFTDDADLVETLLEILVDDEAALAAMSEAEPLDRFGTSSPGSSIGSQYEDALRASLRQRRGRVARTRQRGSR